MEANLKPICEQAGKQYGIHALVFGERGVYCQRCGYVPPSLYEQVMASRAKRAQARKRIGTLLKDEG